MQKRTSDPKTLASAGNNCKPLFESAVMTATTAMICNLSVQVICASNEQLSRWRQVFDHPEAGDLPINDRRPQIHHLNRASLAEWRATLGRQQADLTVLAGFQTAQRQRKLSAAYADALVDAVPSGMVVLA